MQMQQTDLMLSMLSTMTQQTPAPQPADEAAPQDSAFSRLMKEQSGTADQKAPVRETPRAEEKPAAPEKEEPAVADVEQQMALAAMMTMQRPVVPMEQAMQPVQQQTAVATPETVEAAAPVPVPVEAVAAPEQPILPETAPLQPRTAQGTPETAEAAPAEEPLLRSKPETAEKPVYQQMTEQAEQGAVETRTPVREASSAETETDPEGTPEEMVDTRLFKQVESAPIKVADAPAAERPAETPEVETQLSNRLQTALQNGETRVAIQLTPESLGRVTVEMTWSEQGGLHVAMTAESSHTAGLLERSMNSLAQLLGDQTGQTVTVEVQQPQQSERQNLFYDGRDGAGQGEGQDEQRQRQEDAQRRREAERRREADFVHQLRLGLI